VLTGVAVLAPDGREASRVVETRVTFKRLSHEEVEGYISSGEWRGKGGYGIQVTPERRDHFRLLSIRDGLPLYETVCLLEGPAILSAFAGPRRDARDALHRRCRRQHRRACSSIRQAVPLEIERWSERGKRAVDEVRWQRRGRMPGIAAGLVSHLTGRRHRADFAAHHRRRDDTGA
jgi:hypothetical protein